MTPNPVSVADAKALARKLRAGLAKEGTDISHGQSLEMVARQSGFRDWNAFCASDDARRPMDWSVGDRVRGRYLGQSFEAEIFAAEKIQPGWHRLTLDLDNAVDVVSFDSFSNLRKRVTGVIGPGGTSRQKTSNGLPHIELESA